MLLEIMKLLKIFLFKNAKASKKACRLLLVPYLDLLSGKPIIAKTEKSKRRKSSMEITEIEFKVA